MLKSALIPLLIVFVLASTVSAREIEGVDIPERMEDGPHILVLNGAGVRNILFLKFYIAALYLPAATTDAKKIIDANQPMSIRLHMISDINQATMKRACYNGFLRATHDNTTPIDDRIDIFNHCFSDPIKAGDIFDFKYDPQTGLQLYKFEDLRGTISGMDFKKALFGIWLCDNPTDDELRQALLAADVRTEAAEISDGRHMQPDQAARVVTGREYSAGSEGGMLEIGSGMPGQVGKIITEEQFVQSDVYFDAHDASFSDAARKVLFEKVEWLKHNPARQVTIEVYFNGEASDSRAADLAEKRACRVVDFVIASGICPDRIETAILGGAPTPVTETAGENSQRVHFRIRNRTGTVRTDIRLKR